MGVIGHLGSSPAPRIMSASLADVSRSHALRCDAKQSEDRFAKLDQWFANVPHFVLGDMLPTKMVKGAQPDYQDGVEEGIPVVTTMAIQNLAIDITSTRVAVSADYGEASIRKPVPGDVLVTVDGGTSIGKPVLFDLEGDWAVDGHVAILRPVGLDSRVLVYLLASPLGQIQFQRAESGASGQTAVTEDDIRRFKFPELTPEIRESAANAVESARSRAAQLRAEAAEIEADGWEDFLGACAPGL